MSSILIADDEPHVRALLRTTLAPEFQTIEATDGASALHLLLTQRPAVAILDVAMPHATGIEVCRQLRADPRTANTRVIIVTANGTAEDRAAAHHAGADHFITKPFSPLAIARLVRTLLTPSLTTPS